MSEPLLDYHVGLVRGHLLTSNAHQQILAAFDRILDHYKSKAGDVIGNPINLPHFKKIKP